MPNQKDDPLKLLELLGMESDKAWLKWTKKRPKSV